MLFFQFIFLHLKYELLTKHFTYKEYDTPCGPKSDGGDGPRIYYLFVANWLGFGTGHTTRIKEWIIVWHRDYHFYIISNETNETQWNLFKSFKTYWRKSKVNLLLLQSSTKNLATSGAKLLHQVYLSECFFCFRAGLLVYFRLRAVEWWCHDSFSSSTIHFSPGGNFVLHNYHRKLHLTIKSFGRQRQGYLFEIPNIHFSKLWFCSFWLASRLGLCFLRFIMKIDWIKWLFSQFIYGWFFSSSYIYFVCLSGFFIVECWVNLK